ncbi:hypothetical protein [Jiangella asiatica]|uniref:Uncharacterized protein n=1 Tax=Jiangella asiatica TaxID=2530372 RepID=A0A4R5CL76_9ACTN|nr:hypothetical protein [Jiangella asiatica]TDD98204.1 hypothetical protein E1269_29105 [Jiangella asiatica]
MSDGRGDTDRPRAADPGPLEAELRRALRDDEELLEALKQAMVREERERAAITTNEDGTPFSGSAWAIRDRRRTTLSYASGTRSSRTSRTAGRQSSACRQRPTTYG